MTATFHGISPIVIYESNLHNIEEIKEVFHNKFSEYGFDIRFVDGPDGGPTSTGEYLGKSYLHNDQDFEIFFEQLKFHITEYLTKLGFASHKLSYHILKSWYVIISNLNGMNFHHHDSADLSFVYYVDVPEDCANIRFLNQNFRNQNAIFNGIFISGDTRKNFIGDFNNPHVRHSHPFKPGNGKLLLFPSSLEHGIEDTDNSIKRYSIAGDIKFTLKKEILDYETGLVHPSLWKEL
jgi:uncharacterized protein (TIGR02466 family)